MEEMKFLVINYQFNLKYFQFGKSETIQFHCTRMQWDGELELLLHFLLDFFCLCFCFCCAAAHGFSSSSPTIIIIHNHTYNNNIYIIVWYIYNSNYLESCIQELYAIKNIRYQIAPNTKLWQSRNINE